jgi:hypothetical protein
VNQHHSQRGDKSHRIENGYLFLASAHQTALR